MERELEPQQIDLSLVPALEMHLVPDEVLLALVENAEVELRNHDLPLVRFQNQLHHRNLRTSGGLLGMYQRRSPCIIDKRTEEILKFIDTPTKES